MNRESQSNINAMKEQIGMPEHLTPPKIIPKHSPHGGGPGTVSRPPPSAPTGTGGPPSQGGGSSRGRGRNPWCRADGGLIDFYRYGGFVG